VPRSWFRLITKNSFNKTDRNPFQERLTQPPSIAKMRGRKAPSPSGKAADCKSAIPGSNPGGASLIPSATTINPSASRSLLPPQSQTASEEARPSGGQPLHTASVRVDRIMEVPRPRCLDCRTDHAERTSWPSVITCNVGGCNKSLSGALVHRARWPASW
jgi:hypothetical protein